MSVEAEATSAAGPIGVGASQRGLHVDHRMREDQTPPPGRAGPGRCTKGSTGVP